MKKIYMMPEVQVVNVKMNTMVMMSSPRVGLDPNEDVDAEEVESRSSSIWDDDEDY